VCECGCEVRRRDKWPSFATYSFLSLPPRVFSVHPSSPFSHRWTNKNALEERKTKKAITDRSFFAPIAFLVHSSLFPISHFHTLFPFLLSSFLPYFLSSLLPFFLSTFIITHLSLLATTTGRQQQEQGRLQENNKREGEQQEGRGTTSGEGNNKRGGEQHEGENKRGPTQDRMVAKGGMGLCGKGMGRGMGWVEMGIGIDGEAMVGKVCAPKMIRLLLPPLTKATTN
jgi:hypothetical protein